MSGITSSMYTALSGLELFEAGISTVSNNLANATTDGYSVEGVDSQTVAGQPGQPGEGVQAATITRAASGFAAAQLRNANAANSAATAQATSLTSISNALTNNGNVQTAINQFFQDVSTLAAEPTSTAQRQTVLADATNVTSTFQSASGVINGTIAGASTTLSQSVSAANNLLAQLAAINKSLVAAPNEPSLLDQQQSALNSLSQLLPVSVLPQPNGSVIVTSGGTVLLDQGGVQTLSVTQGSPPAVVAGNNDTPVTLSGTDGALGAAAGTVQAGTAALQSLSTIAAVFAIQVNTAQAEGLTASGTPGQALFSVPAPSATPAASNTGSAVITAQIANAAALPIDGGPFTLSYNGSSWKAQDQSNGQNYPVSGTPPSFAGISFAVLGTAAAGDSFSINPAPDASTGIAVLATSGDEIAAADPYVGTPGTLQADGSIADTNAGSVATGTDSVTSTPAAGAAVVPSSYYGQDLQLNFTSATAYTVSTTAAPGTVIASGTLGANGGNFAIAYPAGAAAGQYWQLPVTGTPVAGDVLTLTPGGSSSGSNAQRLGTLWTTPGATTTGTLEEAVVGLSTGLGANAQAAQQLAIATTGQVATTTENLQAIAGVDTDQQAVLLTNFSQAYQAAAQAITAAHTMFESLLTAV